MKYFRWFLILIGLLFFGEGVYLLLQPLGFVTFGGVVMLFMSIIIGFVAMTFGYVEAALAGLWRKRLEKHRKKVHEVLLTGKPWTFSALRERTGLSDEILLESLRSLTDEGAVTEEFDMEKEQYEYRFVTRKDRQEQQKLERPKNERYLSLADRMQQRR